MAFIHGDSPVINYLHKLRFTRKSRLESLLVSENNVVVAEVFPRVAKDNMVHHLAQNTSYRYWSIDSSVAFIAFLCITVSRAVFQACGSLPVVYKMQFSSFL